MKNLVSLALFIMLTTPLLAQKIEGSVYSASQLLASATISIENNDHIFTSKTDSLGKFLINAVPKGTYLLKVNHIGYESFYQTIDVLDTGIMISVALQPASTTIAEVVVTRTKTLIENKADRYIFNLEGTTLSSGNDAFNMLAISPGVVNVGGQIGIHGKFGPAIYIDNKRIPNDNIEHILRGIPAEQIAKIEIIHKPSSKYDADNAAGVILITTKRKADDGWNLFMSANTSQGKKFGYGGNAKLDLKVNKFNFSISGSGLNRGDIEDGYNIRYISLDSLLTFNQHFNYPDKRLRTYAINSELIYNLTEGSQIGFIYNSTNPDLTANGNVSSTFNNSTVLTSNEMETGITFNNYNAFADILIDSTNSSTLYISGNMAKYKQDAQQLFYTGGDAFNNLASATFDIYTATADYSQHIFNGGKLETGVKYTNTNNNSEQNSTMGLGTNFSYEETIKAAYGRLSHQFGKFDVAAGLRFEHTKYGSSSIGQDSSYANLFYNILTTYKVNNNYNLSLFYNKSIQRPGYSALVPYVIYRDAYSSFQGNPYLKPEYNNEVSLSNIYKSYSLSFSYTWSRNKILPVFSYLPENTEYRESSGNFDTGDVFSANLFVPIKITSWWTSNISATALRNSFTYAYLGDEQAISRAKNTLVLSSLTNFSWGNNWTSTLAATYMSPSMMGVVDISSLSNFTVGVKKTFLDKRASLAFEISDIFYQSNVRSYTDFIFLRQESRILNDTRRAKLTFSYSMGKKIDKKDVDAKNIEEKTRLGI